MVETASREEQNADSWRQIVAFYENFIENRGVSRLEPMLCLVKHIAASDWAKLLHASHSLDRLLISTKPVYPTEQGDTFVRVALYKGQGCELTYMEVENPHKGARELERRHCGEGDVLHTLTPFLDRLWRDTTP